ncbi:Monooxygenase [Azospirillaceae bacterium]
MTPCRRILLSLAIGGLGGCLFAWLHWPLAWMLGAMTSTTACSLAGARLIVPKSTRSVMMMVLGVALGGSFSPALQDRVGTLGGVAVYTIVAAGLGGCFLRRVIGYDSVTAFFAATPGGLSEMTIIGGAMGGNERLISMSHALRLMMVVFATPLWVQLTVGAAGVGLGAARGFPSWQAVWTTGDLTPLDGAWLAGCLIGGPVATLLKVPASSLLGPMALSIVVHALELTTHSPPLLLVMMAQVGVGAAIGCRFSGLERRSVLLSVGPAIGLTALMLIAVVAMAAGLSRWTGISEPLLVLALAPGGLAEMSMAAWALGEDPAFVTAHHLARIVFVIVGAPTFFALRRRFSQSRAAAFSGGFPPFEKAVSGKTRRKRKR